MIAAAVCVAHPGRAGVHSEQAAAAFEIGTQPGTSSRAYAFVCSAGGVDHHEIDVIEVADPDLDLLRHLDVV